MVNQNLIAIGFLIVTGGLLVLILGEVGVRIGRISRLLSPSYGSCLACHTTWRFVEWHDTTYTEAQGIRRGMFPLCQKCWEGLATPQARMPYYQRLYRSWEQPAVEWSVIERAVLDGK